MMIGRPIIELLQSWTERGENADHKVWIILELNWKSVKTSQIADIFFACKHVCMCVRGGGAVKNSKSGTTGKGDDREKTEVP